MAFQDQLAELPGGRDEVFHNYGVSDIAAHTIVKLDGTNFVGDTNNTTIPGIVLPSTGGDPSLCVGITLETIKAGANGRVRCGGLAYAIAQGAIGAGVTVDADVTTAGRANTHTAAKASIGFSRSAAGALGDPVLIDVRPSLNA